MEQLSVPRSRPRGVWGRWGLGCAVTLGGVLSLSALGSGPAPVTAAERPVLVADCSVAAAVAVGPWRGQGGEADSGDCAAASAAPSGGLVRARWLGSGAAAGPLGFPIGGEVPLGHGSMQPFQYGSIFWSPGSAAQLIRQGELAQRFATLGGATGRLGFPVGDREPVADGWVQQFATAFLVWGPTTGAVAVEPATYRRWTAHREQLGWPTQDSVTDASGSHTGFQRGGTVWDPQREALFSDTLAGADTALVLGDSQLAGDSWTEQAVRALGYTHTVEFGFGGWGYTVATPATGGTPAEVISSEHLLLPHGDPGVIVVTLGGNDATTGAGDSTLTTAAAETWAELRRRYPHSPIVVNGVLSTTAANHARRRQVDGLLMSAASAQGLAHISVAGLATRSGAPYADAVHLTPTGHGRVAAVYARELRGVVGR